MTRLTYSIVQEPRGDVYRQLIVRSVDHGDTFLLVVRGSPPLSETGQAVMSSLRAFLISRTEDSEWPGTRLLDEKATLYRFSLTPAAAAVLAAAAQGLYSWVQPDLPEDLCVFTADGSPWLVTISHEHDAFMMLFPEEKEALAAQVPGLALQVSGGESSAL